jgi:hypothetical protein
MPMSARSVGARQPYRDDHSGNKLVSLNPLHTLEKQLYEVLSLHRRMRKEAARA